MSDGTMEAEMRGGSQIRCVLIGFFAVVGCGGGGTNEAPTDLGKAEWLPTDQQEEAVGDIVELLPGDLPFVDGGHQDVPYDKSEAMDETSLHDAKGDVASPILNSCDPAVRIGRFQVGMKKFGSEFSGRVFDSVDFSGVSTLKESDGECRIVQRKPWFCDPACLPGMQCSTDGTCVPVPAPVGVGVVTVDGLSLPVAVSADAGFNYTFLDFTGAPFLPGAPVTLSAQGQGPFAPFSLAATGVEPLVLETSKWILQMLTPFVARWKLSQHPGTILISLNVDQHGSTPATLLCEVEDDGEFEIPANMVSALLLYGVNGAPTAQVFRRTVDSIDLEQGCVEFEVYSQVNLVVSTN